MPTVCLRCEKLARQRLWAAVPVHFASCSRTSLGLGQILGLVQTI